MLRPARDVAAALAIGSVAQEVPGPGRPALDGAIEAVVRTLVARRWPGRSTTDGSLVHVVGRPAADLLVVAAATWFDFTGQAVVVRVRFALVPGRERVVVDAGDVDPSTGLPRRMDPPVLVAGDDPGLRDVEVIDGRLLRRVAWSPAGELRWWPDERG